MKFIFHSVFFISLVMTPLIGEAQTRALNQRRAIQQRQAAAAAATKASDARVNAGARRQAAALSAPTRRLTAAQAPSAQLIDNATRGLLRMDMAAVNLAPMMFTYEQLCPKTRGPGKNVVDICRSVMATPICQKVPAKDRRSCDKAGLQQVVDPWAFLKGCTSGVGVAITDLLKFVKDVVMFVFNETASVVKTGRFSESTRQYAKALKLYVNIEYERAYAKSSPPLRKMKAMARMGPAIAKMLLNRLSQAIYAGSLDFGCYSYQKQSEISCQVIASLLIPPTGALAIIKYGPKAVRNLPAFTSALNKAKRATGLGQASRVLYAETRANAQRLAQAQRFARSTTPNAKPLSRRQNEAVIEAHEVGAGQLGRNGTPAKTGNYTPAQLREKAKVLDEAGFNVDERRRLIESGTVGDAPQAYATGLGAREIELFDRVQTSPMPSLSSTDSGILMGLKGSDEITVNITDFGETRTKRMTVTEALEKAVGVDDMRVVRVHLPERTPTSVVRQKVPATMLTQDGVFKARIEFSSGEIARFNGSKEQLIELAANKNVKSVSEWADSTHIAPPVYRVPETHRNPTHDPVAQKFDEIPSDRVTTSADVDLAGAGILHGTSSNFRASVEAGPKNLGRGYGGEGLYLTLEADRGIAEMYAGKAAKEWENRVQWDNIQATNGVSRPEVMVGTINPDRNLSVGVFEIQKDGRTDLSRGILAGPDWANDEVLRRTLSERFDVLDLRGAARSEIPGLPDRFLVIHERAGPDAIQWKPRPETTSP